MKIRNKDTPRRDFVTYSKRLMRVICEEGIACLNPRMVDVVTPTQSVVTGPEIDVASVVVVSIIRAGDSMLGMMMMRYLVFCIRLLSHRIIS